ncbi:OmpA family protein [Aquimarina sp. MMG015]|uniref:OmpA family protein n=1 Tax=unclassified Aquimarina TaxID=2627091 RepID=UPI000E53A9C6|nr:MULTISPECIES: OmpA family protein [unclassified Aquimarina]AXT57682.1 OmpA family protein [Aquimarina sp. AD1]MBQ4805474.1 OmpA family protein [Aquimarina sp. MMG015]RKN34324.1 OmpA family protein [Aquimarina sp. AD1]
MKTTKQIIGIAVLFFMMCIPQNIEAQFWKKVAKTAERAAEKTVLKKTEEKVSKKTSKTIDDTVDGKPKKKKKKNKSKKTKKKKGAVISSDNEVEHEIGETDTKPSFAAYSKFDFVAGENVIAFEDFSQDEIGDLPARWNSSNSAEVVTLNNTEGRFIQIGAGKGSYVPEFIEEFPENFTLEYDVVFDYDVSEYAYQRDLMVVFSDVENPGYELQDHTPGKNGFAFAIRGGNSYGGKVDVHKYCSDSKLNLSSDKQIAQLDKKNNSRGEKMHISIWKQKQRMRIYIDEKKVFDIPRAFEKTTVLKNVKFFSQTKPENTFYYVGNIRYAVGKPDMRNKLITEGKLVTYGITFDTGKASVKSASYGTIKKIAKILSDNPTIKVSITGHTDKDGDEVFNQKLSKKRAVSVKNVLVDEFGIDGSRLETNGKGESDPISKENTLEAKAKNRRVEFKKL